MTGFRLVTGFIGYFYIQCMTQTPWPESESELYGLSDLRLLAKLVLTFADKGVSRSQRGESPTAVTSVF
jgi:hypothetical protein